MIEVEPFESFYPRKFVKEGKKFVKIGDLELELAPRELVFEYADRYKISEFFDMTYTQQVEVGGKVEMQGWVKAPSKAGKYKLSIKFFDEESRYSETTDIGYVTVTPTTNKLEGKEVVQAYKNVFGNRASSAKWLLADSYYYKANITDIRAVLNNTKIKDLPYVAEDYDCDDYAWALMGVLHADPFKPMWMPTGKQAVFVTWVWWQEGSRAYGHALNTATDGTNVWMIEPQNYTIFAVPDNWNLVLLIG